MHVLFAANFGKGNTGDFIYRAFKQLGHRVTFISPIEREYGDCIKVRRDVSLPEIIRELDEKPDLFLYADCSEEVDFFPEGITRLDIPTLFWALDNHLNFRWHKEYAGLFDYVFYTQLGRMKLAQKMGVKNVRFLPFAIDKELIKDSKSERSYDVGYVGSITEQKAGIFRKLKMEGVNIHLFHWDSRKKQLSIFKELENYGVNVHTSGPHFHYDAVGRFYSRCKLVFNIAPRRVFNPRTFEACAAGAALLNPAGVDEGFYEVFTPGENSDVYHHDNAATVLKEYLKNPDKLAGLAQKGKKMMTQKHTYQHRVMEILRVAEKGVTEKRIRTADSYLMHIKAAMTYQHPQFRLRKRARSEFKAALRKNFPATLLYLAKYAACRVYEKAEKIAWSLGRWPM
jgi:hypothetical protein